MRLFGRDTQPGLKVVESTSDSPVSAVLGLAADRIAAVVAAADRAVADIRVEVAEQLAGSPVDENQISRERLVAELAQSLVERADQLGAEATSLAAVLERASARLEAQEPAPAPPIADPDPAPRSDLDQRVSERFGKSGSGDRVPFKRRLGGGEERAVVPKQHSSDGLRLLATQMAVAGSTRDEIEARLRDEFGVADVSSLLGDVAVPRGGR